MIRNWLFNSFRICKRQEIEGSIRRTIESTMESQYVNHVKSNELLSCII